MIVKPENMKVVSEANKTTNKKLELRHLITDDAMPKNLNMFAHATLEIGAEVPYHKHVGETETYYILTGCGTYNDNGTEIVVKSGDVTFTADGESHGLRNNGTVPLEFMALIVSE